MVFAGKLSVVTVCALLVWGCAEVPLNGPDVNRQAVKTVTLGQSRACRVVDTLSVENQSSRDEDAERGAMRKARAMAVARGGDAILIQSTAVTPSRSSGVPSVMTLKGNILVCHANTAANTTAN